MSETSTNSSARAHLERRAATNHGLILRKDALAAGLTKAQIDRRVRRGHWVPGPVRGSLILADHADDPVASLFAAVTCLPDTVAFASSAVALWGLIDHPQRPVVLASMQRRAARVDLRVLSAADTLATTRKQGVRTVTLEVAIASLAAELDVRAMHRLIDEALRRQLTTPDRVTGALQTVVGLTRPGRNVLRQVLVERGLDPALPLSAWSRDFADRLVDAGLPRPTLEFRIVDCDGLLIAQVDLAFPDHRYAIELDSIAFHLDRDSFETDRRRDVELASRHWAVDRFTWRQFVDEWPWIVSVIQSRLDNFRPG